MIIPKKIYEELEASRDYYKQLAFDWEKIAQNGLEVAKQIANTRDKYIAKYKQLVKRNTPMKTVEKKLPYVGEEEREHYCPNCNKFLGFHFQYRHKFCRECGQALKYKEEIE